MTPAAVRMEPKMEISLTTVASRMRLQLSVMTQGGFRLDAARVTAGSKIIEPLKIDASKHARSSSGPLGDGGSFRICFK